MKELAIPLDGSSGMPLYQQIYEYIRQEIVDGGISTGERLPSTRLLAKHLQVSRSTTALAYDQLFSEGYVRAVPGSGYYVCEMETLDLGRPRAGADISPVEVPAPEPRCRYDFSPNDVEWPEFSMEAWRKAVKRMLQENREELFQQGESQGEHNLRQVICEYLHHARGVTCDVGQILIGAGNEYLLMLLCQIFSGEDWRAGRTAAVAMESPTYLQAARTFWNMGWQVEAVLMDECGMSVEGLRQSRAKLAYIMPSHQFPLGNVMPLKRRMELLNWAEEEPGRYIIEDDYDSEFRYKGKPIPSLQGNDPYGRVIYLGTFSKSISPAIRVSYVALPQQLMEQYQKRCSFYANTVSRQQQQILYHFMKEGYFERHLNKMRGIYKSRHDVLLAALRERPWVRRIFGENSGLHILVEVDTALTEEQVVVYARQKDVRVYGLKEYSIGSRQAGNPKSPCLLLGYGKLTDTEILRGLELLDHVLE